MLNPCQDRLERRGVEAGDMEKQGMIEPDHFGGLRMASYGGPDLARSEHVAVKPFKVYRGVPAVSLDQRSIIGLKNDLPGKAQPVSIVSDIQHLFVGKLLYDASTQPFEDISTICNRSRPLPVGRPNAEKPYLHRPDKRIGLLIMEQYILIGGMICRCIDVAAE